MDRGVSNADAAGHLRGGEQRRASALSGRSARATAAAMSCEEATASGPADDTAALIIPRCAQMQRRWAPQLSSRSIEHLSSQPVGGQPSTGAVSPKIAQYGGSGRPESKLALEQGWRQWSYFIWLSCGRALALCRAEASKASQTECRLAARVRW
jgi:hypothetical protein